MTGNEAIERIAIRLDRDRTARERRKGLRIQMAELAENADTQHKAHLLVTEVVDALQDTIRRALSRLVTDALRDVFGEDYTFRMSFAVSRGTVGVECVLVYNGHELDPMDGNGYGVVDLICFAMRAALIGLQPKYRRVMILDEPFKHVSPDRMPSVASFVRRACTELGIQLIMFTNESALIDFSDRVFTVTKESGVSNVSRRDVCPEQHGAQES